MRGPQVEGLTKENLQRLYVDDEDATVASVGEQLGCHGQTVARWIKRFGLPMKDKRRPGKPRKADTQKLGDRDWLAEELETKTQREIARELGTQEDNVSYWVYKHGLRSKEGDFKSRAIKKSLRKKYPSGRTGRKASNWQGGRREVSGYIYVYAPDHPYANNKAVAEHRLVMEKKIGRHLTPDEVVHHLDGNRKNNDPDNLVLYKRGQHVSKHWENGHEVVALEEENARLKAEIKRLKAQSEK
jgi:transposase